MSIHTLRLPDVGEGIAEAELVSWLVAVGEAVTPDTPVAEVLTDKATVEIYAPVSGTVAYLRGAPGDILAVGGEFVGIETGDGATPEPQPAPESGAEPEPEPEPKPEPASATETETNTGPEPETETEPATASEPDLISQPQSSPAPQPAQPARAGGGITASPAVRARARALGIDLAGVAANSQLGRITHEDLDRHLLAGARPGPRSIAASSPGATTQTPMIGLRRKIASKMTASLRIPHITYVDEIDVTGLESLRRSLATEYASGPRLTMLPFVMRAVVMAIADQPHLNSTLDDESEPEMLTTHGAVHLGIATQTPAGLIVPVVHNAQSLDLWATAAEMNRVTTAAREGTASRDDLAGSTITITSLGALGGLATTPIINHPEVAIVGINKMQTRPMWDGAAFVPRSMMNVSSSFDHRVVDGYDAATFVQRIKALLEEPSLLFVDSPPAE